MRYRFGPLLLIAEQRVLFRGETRVPLAPKTFDLLLLLLQNAGNVVNRDTVRQAVWDDAYVDEAVISRNVSLLRSKLRPFFGDTEILETISKTGYRLLVPVTLDEMSPEDTPPPAVVAPEPVQQTAHDTKALVPALTGEATQHLPSGRSSVLRYVAVFALLAAALLVVKKYRDHRPILAHAQQDELAVIRFRDLSGSADAGWMGVALQESLSRGLSRDGGLHAVEGDQVAVAEEDLGLTHVRKFDAAELAQLDRRLGVDYLLTGTYMPVGEQVRMDLVLHWGDKVQSEFSETVERSDLQAVVERATAQMRSSLRLPQAQSGGELQFFSANEVASHFYAEGLGLSRTGNRPRLAREAFSKAVAGDPQFAEAHAALAVAWENVGHEADSRAEAQLALNTCASLPETRKLSVQASAYRLVGRYPEALAALARLRQLHPDGQTYQLRMASTLFSANKLPQATALLRQMEADKTRPANLAALELLATVLAQQGDRGARFIYANRIMELARAEGSPSAEARAHLFAGMGWMSALDGAKAVAEFNQGEKLSTEIDDKVGVIAALTNETAARMAFHMPGAEAVGQRAMDMATEIGKDGTITSQCINLGLIAMYASHLRSAVSYSKRALELGEAARSYQDRQAATNSLVSAYLLSEQLPEAEQAAALELRYAQEAANDDDVANATRHLAEIDAYLGRWSQAEAHFRQAAASFQHLGNQPGANDVLVECAWMLVHRGDAVQAGRLLATVDKGLLEENEALAGYAAADLQAHNGDVTNAETLVTKALAKDPVPFMTAKGLDVLAAIAVRQKDAAKARSVAERYTALAQTIPEDGAVRRGAVRATAQAEILAGNRSGEAVGKLPDLLREALHLRHVAEIEDLRRVLAESKR